MMSLVAFAFAATIQAATAAVLPAEVTVRWKSNDEKPPEMFVSDRAGIRRYRIGLVPLWRVEGGVIAFEIELTSPGDHSVNLLGERGSTPKPFVVELSDLQPGATSPFGKIRTFSFPDLPQAYFRVEFKETRISKGPPDCPSCSNIEQLTAVISVGAK